MGALRPAGFAPRSVEISRIQIDSPSVVSPFRTLAAIASPFAGWDAQRDSALNWGFSPPHIAIRTITKKLKEVTLGSYWHYSALHFGYYKRMCPEFSSQVESRLYRAHHMSSEVLGRPSFWVEMYTACWSAASAENESTICLKPKLSEYITKPCMYPAIARCMALVTYLPEAFRAARLRGGINLRTPRTVHFAYTIRRTVKGTGGNDPLP